MTCLELPSVIERSFTKKQNTKSLLQWKNSPLANLVSTLTTLARRVDPTDATAQKAECLTHFTYERSKKKLMLVDIHGSGFDVLNPEIASTDLKDEANKQYLYCTGNLLEVAISSFLNDHSCNVFYGILGLPVAQL